MKRKYSRYLIIMFLLIGIYPLVSIFNATPIIPIKKNILQTFDGSYYSKNGHHEHLGNNQYRFNTKLGVENVDDGSKYIPYIYNELENSILFASSKLTFYDWYAVLEQNGEVRIDDLRWIVQYWQDQAGGRWVELDLYNHHYYDPVITEKSITIIQSYDDGFSYMNVSYFVSNYEGVKVIIDFLSGGNYELRFNWQLSGMEGGIIGNMSSRTFRFSDVFISCNDTDSSIGFSYDWVVNEKKLDIYLGSYNVLTNERIFIDPTFSGKQETDAYDFYIRHESDFSYTTDDFLQIGLVTTDYVSGLSFNSSINTEISNISNAVLSLYVVHLASMENNDYTGIGLYNKSGDPDNIYDEGDISGNEEAFHDVDFIYENASFAIMWQDEVNYTISCNSLIQAWAEYHNNDSTGYMMIPLQLYNNSWDGAEYLRLAESTDITASKRPSLTFDYTVGAPPTTTTTTTTTATATTTTGEEGESFTSEYEFFLIHFLNNLALYLVQYWFVIVAVSAVGIVIIKVLWFSK